MPRCCDIKRNRFSHSGIPDGTTFVFIAARVRVAVVHSETLACADHQAAATPHPFSARTFEHERECRYAQSQTQPVCIGASLLPNKRGHAPWCIIGYSSRNRGILANTEHIQLSYRLKLISVSLYRRSSTLDNPANVRFLSCTTQDAPVVLVEPHVRSDKVLLRG